MSSSTVKENNNNSRNTMQSKKQRNKTFTGGNSSLQGKIFDMSLRDAIHQFACTVKSIADCVGQKYTHHGKL
jgi:hypothetical protein